MTFLHPWALALVPLCVALGAWEWLRRGRRVAFPFDAARPPRNATIGTLLRAAATLPAIIAAFAAVLLAAPQRPVNAPDDRALRHVQFLLDVSLSMVGSFGPSGTRADAAVAAIETFATRRKGDAFALTLYGGTAINWLPLTRDVAQFLRLRPFIHPRNLPPELAGGTSTGYAFETVCAQLATAPPGERIVVLITDDGAADLDAARTEQVAALLRDHQITVYTVLIDAAAAPPDASRLSDLTGGQLFTAGDPAGLADVFDRIDRLSTIVTRPTAVVLEDRFAPAAASLLVALALHVALAFYVRPTPW